MKALFSLFWQICLLRRGPQDVPYAVPLLVMLVLGVAGLDFASIPLLEAFAIPQTDPTAPAPPSPMIQMAAQLLMLGGWLLAVRLLLRFKRLQGRYVQTMSAALGTDLITSLPQMFFYVVVVSSPADSSLVGFAQVALLVLYIWDMLIKGHIYSQALNIGRVQGNLLSVALWVGLYALSVSLLLPSSN